MWMKTSIMFTAEKTAPYLELSLILGYLHVY